MNAHAAQRLVIRTNWYRVSPRHERVARATRALRRIGATLPSRYMLHALVLSLASAAAVGAAIA